MGKLLHTLICSVNHLLPMRPQTHVKKQHSGQSTHSWEGRHEDGLFSTLFLARIPAEAEMHNHPESHRKDLEKTEISKSGVQRKQSYAGDKA